MPETIQTNPAFPFIYFYLIHHQMYFASLIKVDVQKCFSHQMKTYFVLNTKQKNSSHFYAKSFSPSSSLRGTACPGLSGKQSIKTFSNPVGMAYW